MNHDCHGDVFVRWGKRWGRCFLDSTFFLFEEGTEFCPNCERPWEGVDIDGSNPDKKHRYDPNDDTDVLVKIDLPHFKRLAEERGRKITYLEDKLDRWQKMLYEAEGMTYLASLCKSSKKEDPKPS